LNAQEIGDSLHLAASDKVSGAAPASGIFMGVFFGSS